MASSDWKFVGFNQYIKMFTEDPLFPIAVKNTVKSVLIIVPFTVVLSLTLALGIHSVKSRVNSSNMYGVEMAVSSAVWDSERGFRIFRFSFPAVSEFQQSGADLYLHYTDLGSNRIFCNYTGHGNTGN